MALFSRSAKNATPPKPGPAGGGGRKAAAADKPGRVEQMKAVYKLAAERDPRLLVRVLGPALGVLIVLVVVGVLIGHPVYLSILGVIGGVLLGSVLFTRRANSAVFAQVEGQPGAAAAVLQSMRGDWRVTPVVAATRNYDLVHRAVGRPGVVLIGEGSPIRVRELISQEKKRVGRVAPETPIYDVSVGDGEGQVALSRLQAHLARLPRNLRQTQVNALEARMRALGGTNAPVPKGPLPRGAQRMPRGR